jgi:hypothetical protein
MTNLNNKRDPSSPNRDACNRHWSDGWKAGHADGLNSANAANKKRITELENWIRHEGEMVSGTCCYPVLKEICSNCKCHRSRDHLKDHLNPGEY